MIFQRVFGVRSLRRRFFCSAFVRDWFCRVSKIGSVLLAKFQVWLNQVFKTGLISLAKVLVNFILALWSSFLKRFWLVVFGSCERIKFVQ